MEIKLDLLLDISKFQSTDLEHSWLYNTGLFTMFLTWKALNIIPDSTETLSYYDCHCRFYIRNVCSFY